MTYKMYVMSFQAAHLGTDKLDESALTFSADRLYSALTLEAIKMGKLEEFETLTQSDDFILSDAFPLKNSPFLPKPIGYPTYDNDDTQTDVKEIRRQAKLSKKLKFIDCRDFDAFLQGAIFENQHHAVDEVVTKNQPLVDGNLYQVGVTRYEEDTSLFVIATESDLLFHLLTSLQFSGLGGKRSSGYGRFNLVVEDVPEELAQRLTCQAEEPVMALTTCLPKAEALEVAMAGGHYLLKKASGFAFSSAHKENFRKQDLYKFVAGSTFQATFEGEIVDVRPEGFSHPVWNYARPLFYRLEVSD